MLFGESTRQNTSEKGSIMMLRRNFLKMCGGALVGLALGMGEPKTELEKSEEIIVDIETRVYTDDLIDSLRLQRYFGIKTLRPDRGFILTNIS